MNIRIQIIVAVIVISALIVIFNMVRQKKLELRYALVWIGVGAGILVLNCFPDLIGWLSWKVGIASPTNMLFFFGFLFSLAIVFSLTVAVSRLSTRVKALAQEIALLEKEKEQADGTKKKAEK